MVQRILFAVAFSLLGYSGFAWIDAWHFQRQAEARFVQQLAGGVGSLPVEALGNGILGRIDIPRIGLSAAIAEGDGTSILRRAVGHIPGTGLPGHPNANVGLAGHRDTFFRPLRSVRNEDAITITTIQGAFRYRVVSMTIVSPGDVQVLESTGGEILTLVTCYPFQFVGTAPERFIVRAARVF